MAFVLPLPASVIAEVNELRSWTLWQSRAARRGTPSASAMQGWWGTLPPDLRDVAEDVLTAAGVGGRDWLSGRWPEGSSCPPSLVAVLRSWDGRASHLVDEITEWADQLGVEWTPTEDF